MPERARKPGSKKGQSKPLKRVLAARFPFRLADAMGRREVPELALKIGCTRAVIHKHLNGNSKSIEANLLALLCAELKVSPLWLITGEGTKTGLTTDEDTLLSRYRNASRDEKELMLRISEKMSAALERQ